MLLTVPEQLHNLTSAEATFIRQLGIEPTDYHAYAKIRANARALTDEERDEAKRLNVTDSQYRLALALARHTRLAAQGPRARARHALEIAQSLRDAGIHPPF